MTFAQLGVVASIVFAVGPASAAPLLGFDPGFGTSGKTIGNPAGHDRDVFVTSIAPRPDGGWITAGYTNTQENDEDYQGNTRWFIAAYLANGAPDPQFGSGGRLLRSGSTKASPDAGSWVDAIAVQPDGKILAGGIIDLATNRDQAQYEREAGGDTDCQCSASRAAFLIARYLPNGKLDRTFSKNGFKELTDVSRSWTENGPLATLDEIVVLPSGRIYVLGAAPYYSNGLTANPRDRNRLLGFSLKSNGDVDRSFGTRGRMLVSIGSGRRDYFGLDFVGMKDGGIGVAGWTADQYGDWPNRPRIVTARITRRGTLNRSYAGRGWVEIVGTPKKSFVAAADITADGAAAFTMQRVRGDDGDSAGAIVTAVTAKGNLRQRFGAKGIVDLKKTLGPGALEAGSVTRLEDGTLGLGMSSGRKDGSNDAFVLVSNLGVPGIPIELGQAGAPNAVPFQSAMAANESGVVLASSTSIDDFKRAILARVVPVSP